MVQELKLEAEGMVFIMRSAIVGCGGIAQVHAKVLDALPEAALCGFADIKKERADRMAEQYGGRAYENLEEMLEKEQPEVLHICTPCISVRPTIFTFPWQSWLWRREFMS